MQRGISMKKLVLAALLVPFAVLANEPVLLEPVVVTATGTPVPVSQTLANVILIDRAEIEQSQAVDVTELLQFYAGLEVDRSGGPGQLATVRIRGGEADQVLLLVDGVRINSAATGPTLQHLSPELIERIEIVKGPRSTLYGQDAQAGVIQIFTRRGEGLGGEAKLGFGSNQTRSGAAGFNIADGSGKSQLGFNVEHITSEGFAPCAGDSIDRGYERTAVNLRGDTQIGAVSVGVRAFDTRGNNEYSSFCGPFGSPVDADFAQQALALELGLQATQRWHTQLTLSRAVDDIDQTQSPDFTHSTRPQLDWHNVIELGSHTLSAGGSVAREEADIFFGPSFFGPAISIEDELDLYGVRLQDAYSGGRHHAVLGVAYDDHDTYGDSTTWNAEYGFDLFEQTRWVLSAGTGFRIPNAYERFPGFGGNPDLRPEKSRNYETGIQQRIGRAHRIDLRVFRTDMDDLIAFFGGINQNVNEFRNEGIDLSYHWQTELWSATLTGLLQDPVNRDTDKQLARRAKRSLGGKLQRRFGGHSLGLAINATSDRPDIDALTFTPTTNPGYTLVNLYGSLRLDPQWQLEAKAENVLDKDYQTTAGYNQAGAGFFLSLRWTP